MKPFRDLTADDIECRVSQINENGCALLLYKNARVDMAILDESVGAENWQRRHTRDNANCIVSVWDESKKQWIEKEDTGTESNTEKEKGQASDSFKRACTNWGIGRELYTAPFIWVGADKFNLKQKNGKYSTYDKFVVSEIEIVDKKIVKLEIVNSRTNAVCFKWSKGAKNSTPKNTQSNNASSGGANPKASEQPATQLTEESKGKLNSAIGAYVKLTGIDINQVMAMLKNAIKKSPKTYTESDAKKALSVIAKWQQEFMDSMGV